VMALPQRSQNPVGFLIRHPLKMAQAWAIPVQVSTVSGGSHPGAPIAGPAAEPAVYAKA
jgi:hypothetical protein